MLFDLDDTLLDYSGRAETCWTECCAAVAAPAGVDLAALLTALEDVRGSFWESPERHRRERTDMVGAWAKIAALALERVGGARDGLARRMAEDFAARRVAAERLFPDARATLELLRAAGRPLGLVTNGDARLQRDKIARHDLAPFFDVIVIEGEFGCGKPDARVFRHALASLGADPAGAWMVGDHLVWDVAGAQGVGVRAAWIDRERRGLPAASPARPDRIIHTLGELADLLATTD
ncbi:MAG: HAD family hydrolase [Candidatus Rokuibacteriota bacterium]